MIELIATCAFGLEKLVHDEIKRLGLWVIKTEDGRITFQGDDLGLVRANLWLRCAERVQIKMAEFTATTFVQLFDNVNSIEWEKYIGKNDAFPNNATSVKSMLHSEPAIQSIVKKAMVKRLQQKHNTEILPENSGITYTIFIKANKDQFVISIDSSGHSLHKRGYRLKANLAPMKETLAAALIKLSDWNPQRTLVDPFCGSGTIAIEASMIANALPPGLKRRFAFQKWPWLAQQKIEAAYLEAGAAPLSNGATAPVALPSFVAPRSHIPSSPAPSPVPVPAPSVYYVPLSASSALTAPTVPTKKLRIYCFDIDPDTLVIAQENAKCAGFDNINFKRADFKSLDFSKFENCTFITNPPYGERLEDETLVEEMYREFGNKFIQTKNCSLFLITSNENFPKLFGRPADKNRKLFNGNLRCYLYSYFAKG